MAVTGLIDSWRLCIAALNVIMAPTSSYYRYFQAADLVNVKKVYQRILGPLNWFGPAVMKDGWVRIMYNHSSSPPFDPKFKDWCGSSVTLAHTQETATDPSVTQIVPCDLVFTYRPPYKLDDLGCDKNRQLCFSELAINRQCIFA